MCVCGWWDNRGWVIEQHMMSINVSVKDNKRCTIGELKIKTNIERIKNEERRKHPFEVLQ